MGQIYSYTPLLQIITDIFFFNSLLKTWLKGGGILNSAMDNNQILILIAGGLLFQALLTYFMVKFAVRDGLERLINTNEELLALRKMELRKCGWKEEEFNSAVALGKLDDKLAANEITQKQYRSLKDKIINPA